MPEAFWVIQLKYMPPDSAADVPIVVDEEEEEPVRQRGRPGGSIAQRNKGAAFQMLCVTLCFCCDVLFCLLL